jgi:hypothetical protein
MSGVLIKERRRRELSIQTRPNVSDTSKSMVYL